MFSRYQYQQGANDSSSELPLNPKHKQVQIVGQSSDHDSIEMGSYGGMKDSYPSRTQASRNSSMGDLFSGFKQLDYEHFDTRHATEEHLAFADGDVPKNRLVRFYNYLLNVSIVTRWILFIVPVLGLLWIPGILQLTTFHKARWLGVLLVYWSIWFSVFWGGWWACLAVSQMLPLIVRHTVGIVAVATRRYIDWLSALHRYVALFLWTLIIWVTWNPLIDNRQLAGPPGNDTNAPATDTQTTARNVKTIDFIGRLLFGVLLCASLLLFEKFSIQWIAGKFHERSYAERIADQKFAVRSLILLYRHSVDIPGRSDTLSADHAKKDNLNPRRFFKKVFKSARNVATTTTTALGNVASEIAGTSVLQPNSPAAMVQTALESANKSRLLARRLFYSFAKPGSEFMFVGDIAKFFSDPDMADRVFSLFDRDSNGDASREEVELACAEFHREQLSIEHSMQDLDSAVGRLDNILMTVYIIVAALIIAVVLDAEVTTLLTGAGTLVLGLSWLIGTSLSEVLISIIFLFVKHPYDVGDRVDVEELSYTVKEIRLLSTIFLDSRGVVVQAPNVILNEKFIQNIRRSPQLSEPFVFDVKYSTTFEQLEKFRDRMLFFLKTERRDYLPVFDVTVKDFPNQESMTLTVDIKYKSNAQHGNLKARRRNKWLCQLKKCLAECEIYGPTGNPDAIPDPKRVTNVPWSLVEEEDRKTREKMSTQSVRPSSDYNLRDKNAAILDDSDDVFGEGEEMRMTNPRQGLSGMRPQPEHRSPYPRAEDVVRMPPTAAMVAEDMQRAQSSNDFSRPT